MNANTVEIEGVLQADGRLILDEKPSMPPGRVRVALQALAVDRTGAERLPDAPTIDDGISAPFDLPYGSEVTRVTPRLVADRLPELPSGWAEEVG